MIEAMTIDEVVRRTGISSRALRFYEARGLVKPLRTASGRRLFGSDQLERVHQIVTLKKAGLSLLQIGGLLDRKALDLSDLLSQQLETLGTQARDIASAQAKLRTALSRIKCGEPLDAATLCSLIRDGDRIMSERAEKWANVTDRFFSDDEKAIWAEKMHAVPKDWVQEDYGARWSDLGARIKAAMPLDPLSTAAQAFLMEWQALLEPFMRVATPEMKAGAFLFYERMDEWSGDMDVGFDKSVWEFIKQATLAKARLPRGGK